MTDQEAMDLFVYTALSGDAQLVAKAPGGIHSEVDTDDLETLPAVVYQAAPLNDVNPQDSELQMSGADYIVLGIDQDGGYPYAIEARIHAALQGRSAVIEGYRIRSHRIGPHRTAQTLGGKPFRSIGGRYRVLVSHPT